MTNPAASAFSQLLEQLSNSALALDTASKTKLSGFDGRCVQINAQGSIYSLLIDEQRIRIYHSDTFPWDVRIEGSISDLTQMLLNVGSPSNVQIDGDEILLSELRSIFSNLKPDIETPISKVLGEQPAQAISAFFQVSVAASRVIANTIRDAGTSRMSAHASENFLQRTDFEQFLDTLYSLKLRVDRLNAQITQIEDEAPAASKEPAANKEPVASKEPAANKEPVASKAPAASREPAAKEDSAANDAINTRPESETGGVD